MSELVIKGVSRTFPGVQGGQPTLALQPTNLEIPRNDFVTILGPSGCGKSTLLRIIAGLDRPTTGEVLLSGKAVTGPGADRGMVFQSYTLFPWLTIRENVAFGLRERGVAEKEKWEIVDSYIDKVGLRGFETIGRNNCPAACSRERRLPVPWRMARKSCCWTSLSAPSTTKRAA